MSGASQINEVFGKDLGVVHEAVVTGRKVGAGRNFWSILAHNRDMFWKVLEFMELRPTFNVLLDYTRTLEEMVKTGKYDLIGPSRITSDQFLVKGRGKRNLDIVLFRFFGQEVEPSFVIKEMKRCSFRPCKIEELLAFGAQYPDFQKTYNVVELGSMWDSHVAVLKWSKFSGRQLKTEDLRVPRNWNELNCFVAVQEKAD